MKQIWIIQNYKRFTYDGMQLSKQHVKLEANVKKNCMQNNKKKNNKSKKTEE